MFKKVRIRLTLLSGMMTTLILTIMTCGYLYISEQNLIENRRSSYQSDIYNIAVHLDNLGVISHIWLSQIEASHNCFISLLDNGTPSLFNQKQTTKQRTELLDSLWAYYRDNEPAVSVAISYKCHYQSFSTADYYCFVITVIQNKTPIEMLIAIPLSDIRGQVLRQRFVFLGVVFLALIAIWIFMWIYTKRLLAPIEENRLRQNRFVAAASHELRTPLAVILSCAEAAQDNLASSTTQQTGKTDTSVINLKHDIAAIKNEALRSSRLLNDMLTLSSRDAGHLDIQKAPTELDTLLLNTCEAFERLAAEKNIRLSVVLPDTPVPACCCDAQRIAQTLTILLHNAVSYTPEHGSIAATLSYRKNARRHFSLAVYDTGIGISDDDKTRIFERFYRSEKARSDKNHFGLGLSIAYEIVAAHGGTITAADNPDTGRGTVFTVRLP